MLWAQLLRQSRHDGGRGQRELGIVLSSIPEFHVPTFLVPWILRIPMAKPPAPADHSPFAADRLAADEG